jgi:hypothetical protein
VYGGHNGSADPAAAIHDNTATTPPDDYTP